MLRFAFLSSLVFLLLMGCTSKKVIQDGDAQILSGPMSFDPHGSDGQNIEGLSTIHFDFNRSSLDQKGRDLLMKNAEWIRSHSSVAIQIEGHCDNRGSTEYNLALGELRAKAAYDYLVNLGVNPKQLSTISYGKEKPLMIGDSEVAQAKNRRDNFAIIQPR